MSSVPRGKIQGLVKTKSTFVFFACSFVFLICLHDVNVQLHFHLHVCGDYTNITL